MCSTASLECVVERGSDYARQEKDQHQAEQDDQDRSDELDHPAQRAQQAADPAGRLVPALREERPERSADVFVVASRAVEDGQQRETRDQHREQPVARELGVLEVDEAHAANRVRQAAREPNGRLHDGTGASRYARHSAPVANGINGFRSSSSKRS